MHKQHFKFSTYVVRGGKDISIAVDAIVESLPTSISFSSGGTNSEEPAAAAAETVIVAVVVVAAAAAVVAVVSSLFVSSGFSFLGNNAFFSASASAAAFNRLHSLLCPSFQCFSWHSRLQYWAVLH